VLLVTGGKSGGWAATPIWDESHNLRLRRDLPARLDRAGIPNHSGRGLLQLHAPKAGLGSRLRDQNAVEANNLKDFAHVTVGPRHGECVACLACVSVEGYESGKTSGVNALHLAKIERHVFADDRRRQFLKKPVLLTSHEFFDPQDNVPGRFNPIGIHKNLLARDDPRTLATKLAALAGRLGLELPGPGMSKQRTKRNNAAIGEYAESAGRLCALARSKRGSKCAVSTSASANEQQDSVRRRGEESSVAAKVDNSRGEESPGALSGLTLEQARTFALEAGFQEAGLVALPYVAEARDAERFREWVAKGRAGTMGYLERKAENGRLLREQTAVPFPWARSALVCFASYAAPAAPLSTEGSNPRSGWIARYAWSSRMDERGERRPSDYHKVLLKRIRAVEARLHEQLGEFESRAYVDTGPIVERALAVAAALGWAAKNTCLIHPKLGSFGFLAVLLTSLEASPKDKRVELVTDHCGSCTRCIDACPTNALDIPYQMDATRCIAYLTIEHKGPIPEELAENMGRQVFGCDICQDVCPWNGKTRRSGPIIADTELEPRTELINPALDWLASLDEQSFEREFNGSPVRRTGFMGLRRNVAIAMGNSGRVGFAQQLEAWTTAADDGLRTAARWALARLRRN